MDFQEDTIDGKNTLHATITVAFQPGTDQREALGPLKLDNSETGPLPTSIYDIAPYRVERRRPTFSGHVVEELNLTRVAVYKSSDVLMLLAAGLAASEAIPRSLPVWSTFNSRLNKKNDQSAKLNHLSIAPPRCTSSRVLLPADDDARNGEDPTHSER